MSFIPPAFLKMTLVFFLFGEALAALDVVPSGEILLQTLNHPGTEKTFETVLGNPQAPVVIVAYGSLSCGGCAAFHQLPLEKMREKYEKSGDVCFLLKDYPTDGPSLQASLLTWCFPEKAAPLRKDFYLSQKQWVSAKDPVAMLKEIAQKQGVSAEQCQTCLENKALLHDIVTVHEKEKNVTHLTHVPLVFFVHRKKGKDGKIVMEVKEAPEASFEELDRLTHLALSSSKNEAIAVPLKD